MEGASFLFFSFFSPPLILFSSLRSFFHPSPFPFPGDRGPVEATLHGPPLAVLTRPSTPQSFTPPPLFPIPHHRLVRILPQKPPQAPRLLLGPEAPPTREDVAVEVRNGDEVGRCGCGLSCRGGVLSRGGRGGSHSSSGSIVVIIWIAVRVR